MKPEAKAVKKIMKWLLEQEGDGFKVHGNMYQRSGEPDLTGSIKWRGIWLHYKFEVKAPKGESSRKLDALQMHRLRIWHKCAKVVGVVRSVDDVRAILDAHADYIGDYHMNGFNEVNILYWLERNGISNEHNLYGGDEWEH